MEKNANIVTWAEQVLEPMGPGAGEMPFTQVDSLILSWVSYLHLSGALLGARADMGCGDDPWQPVPLARLLRAECFAEMLEGVWDQPSTRRLFCALAASPRYRDALVCGFTEELDEAAGMQFSAMSFQLTPSLAYLAFRGTDSTLVGWKEDFNLAFESPVPAQARAALYTAQAAGHLSGSLLLGGHSKGGNLALYAAAMCPGEGTRDRIAHAFSHDGPGFMAQVLDTPEFARMLPRFEKTVPQSSIVGLLLESRVDFDIVRSRQVSVLQHDPFSWAVDVGGRDFERLERLSADARYFDRALNGWICQMSAPERGRMTEALYQVLSSAEASTFDQIKADWRTSLPAIARALSDLEPDTRDFLLRVLAALAKSGARSIPETLGEAVGEIIGK